MYTHFIFYFFIFTKFYLKYYIHLIFWKGFFIYELKFNINYDMLKKLYEY
jgi:hypothetical protein